MSVNYRQVGEIFKQRVDRRTHHIYGVAESLEICSIKKHFKAKASNS